MVAQPRKAFSSVQWGLLILAVLSFVIHVYNIGHMNLPAIFDDEMGYWANASYFAGLDWTGSMNGAYYSYGYSLILAPLFKLFNDPVIMYRAVVVINCILAAAIVPIAYRIGKRLFPKVNQYVLMITAFCMSLYSAYIVQANLS